MVGESVFQDEARKLMTADQINAMSSIRKFYWHRYFLYDDSQMAPVHGQQMTEMAGCGIELLEFIAPDVGGAFLVNRMLALWTALQRELERRNSRCYFLELNLHISAYDFVELNKRFGCRLQMGGSDSWSGNIINA